MSLLVQKFGGSSVADAEKLLHVAHIAKAAHDAGNDVIVVVSAQGDATDELLKKAGELSASPPPRETDALLAAGEQVSAALTAMALASLGAEAVSLNAWQTPILTDGTHGDAQIVAIPRDRIAADTARRRIAVVTGFQGVSDSGDVTTLGRGGSDYSAVALAAAFHAERCMIYTDVDGVYTADPRICPTARRLESVSCEDMYALARAGAQVLHDKCVRLAQRRGVTLEVRSCAPDSAGTRVAAEECGRGVTGVTCRMREGDEYAAVTLVGRALPSLRLEKESILALNASDIIVHGVDAGERTLTLYVEKTRCREAICAVHDATIK